MRRISETLARDFQLTARTTTHFLATFLASLSFRGAMRLSKTFPFKSWKNPLGNLILLSFRKVDDSMQRLRRESTPIVHRLPEGRESERCKAA
ncbi:MAG: hypothetical protein ABFC77_02110 [Thermoguttaceae bacterium]